MRTITATTRVTIGLICLSISIWLLAYALGMFPNRKQAIVDGRLALSDNVALHCSLLAGRNDWRTMETSLEGLVSRNDDIQSAAIRRANGSLLVSVGPHAGQWTLSEDHQSTELQIRVPILSGDSEWGIVELRFDENTSGVQAWHPLIGVGVFVAAATYLLFFCYLSRMLQHLDPSRVIPRRVRQTLDNMAEGLLVVDKHQRILLANRAFADSIGVPAEELTGRRASQLPFEVDETQVKIEGFPWERAMSQGEPQIGDMLTLRGKSNQQHVMRVSATPIYGDDGQQRGALASFDDVTQMEQNRVELRQMLDSLSRSRDEIQRQNLELERAASHDPLTGCLNRRAFFTEIENHWSASARYGYPVSCVMIDLDHFKSINDTYGHHTGDIVLQATAELLRAETRRSDIVARFGGEEFCVLMPNTDLNGATIAANQIREAIANAEIDGPPVTASIGVSSREMGAETPQEMIDQADKCLYVAKRNGRDQVIRFDEAGEAITEFETGTSDDADLVPAGESDELEASIPFHAVTALLSALAYRDVLTANHSRRVADLAASTARRLMPTADAYVLEIAALLHDIGKIGIPDSILLKPEKLTEDEWKVMYTHRQMGVEIVKSTFSSPKLTEILETYRLWFGGNPSQPDLPTGEDIPLAARILAIADAYDSMTSKQSYRESLTPERACEELRHCAGRQFDPDLVERFIDAVPNGGHIELSIGDQAGAISFGAQIEALAEALDRQDLDGLAVLAHRLNLTSTRVDAPEVATRAAQLEQATHGDTDLKQILQLSGELLEICRSTQRAYLDQAVGSVVRIGEDQPAADPGEINSACPAQLDITNA